MLIVNIDYKFNKYNEYEYHKLNNIELIYVSNQWYLQGLMDTASF